MKEFVVALTKIGAGLAKFLREMPSWVILSTLFAFLQIMYHLRPDSLTEDAVKGVLGALLLSMRPHQQPPH